MRSLYFRILLASLGSLLFCAVLLTVKTVDFHYSRRNWFAL